MILGRAEAYASKQRLGATVVNALGMGTGFTFALLCLGVVREILGASSLFMSSPTVPMRTNIQAKVATG